MPRQKLLRGFNELPTKRQEGAHIAAVLHTLTSLSEQHTQLLEKGRTRIAWEVQRSPERDAATILRAIEQGFSGITEICKVTGLAYNTVYVQLRQLEKAGRVHKRAVAVQKVGAEGGAWMQLIFSLKELTAVE